MSEHINDTVASIRRVRKECRALMNDLDRLSDLRETTDDASLNSRLAAETIETLEALRIVLTHLSVVATGVFVRSEMDYLAHRVKEEAR